MIFCREAVESWVEVVVFTQSCNVQSDASVEDAEPSQMVSAHIVAAPRQYPSGQMLTPGINMDLKWQLVTGSLLPAVHANKQVHDFCLTRRARNVVFFLAVGGNNLLKPQ